MKANELMIGDWCFIKNYPIKALPQKVQPEHFVRSLIEFEPIPLTGEILEKNGFEGCEEGSAWSIFQHKEEGKSALYQIYWSTNGFYLEISAYTSQIGDFNRMGIQFVHELQHALRLCGIDKTIKL